MKRKELLDLGIAEEVVDQIMAIYGKSVTKLQNSLAETETERDNFKSQVDQANVQIKAFESMDIEGVKKTAADWETKYKEAERLHGEELEKVRFSHDLEAELKDVYRVKDPKEVLPHLDMSLVKRDGKVIVGLKDQIEPLVAAKSYLFSEAKSEDTVDSSSDDSDGGNTPRLVTGSTKTSEAKVTNMRDAISERMKS